MPLRRPNLLVMNIALPLLAAGMVAGAQAAERLREPARVRAAAVRAQPAKAPVQSPTQSPAGLAARTSAHDEPSSKAAPAAPVVAHAPPAWTRLSLALTRPLRGVLGFVTHEALAALPGGAWRRDATWVAAGSRLDAAVDSARSVDWVLQLRTWQDPTLAAPLGQRPQLAQAPDSAMLRELFESRDRFVLGKPQPQLNVGLTLRF